MMRSPGLSWAMVVVARMLHVEENVGGKLIVEVAGVPSSGIGTGVLVEAMASVNPGGAGSVVTSSDQSFRVPVSRGIVSDMVSVQVPFGSSPANMSIAP